MRVIYFIQSDDGPIKIGKANNPKKRLGQLQTASPYQLSIVATMPGDQHLEKKIHSRFSRFQITGEWFSPDQEILDYIARFAFPAGGQGVRACSINTAIELLPDLTDFGLGVWEESVLSPDDRKKRFAQCRLDLLNSESDFYKTCEWLRQIKKIKGINYNHTSYGYKHIAEKSIGYITNGVFIAAAIGMGFDFETEPGNPNVWFNISEKSIEQFDNLRY